MRRELQRAPPPGDAQRVAGWMQDGREDRLLAAWPENEAWHEEPFLTLQHGIALTRVDRLVEAESEFRRALKLDKATPAQRKFAERWLAWLDTEWQTIEKARAALTRSRIGIGGGLGLVALCCVGGWVIARRRRLAE